MNLLPWAVILLLAAAPALAQPGDTMPGMPAGANTASPTPSAQAYRQAMQDMMNRMGAPVTGDADRDFVNGMIPHHQGAIEMAQVELRYGHDPALRRLARRMIAAQHDEIAEMRAWQARHGGAPAR